MKKFFAFFYWIMLFSLTCFISCQNDDGRSTVSKEERKSIVLSRSEEEMAAKNTDFALNLFKQIDTRQTENWIASPLSASYALGMMANGASGKTLDEIMTTLGIGSSLEEMNAFHQKLTSELEDLDNRVQLGIANSIWIDNDFPIYDSFKDINRNTYQAQIDNLDFASVDALNIINDWIAQQTNGHIEDAIKKIPDSTVVYLLNALYFQGGWKNKFEEKNTKDMNFTNADGSTTQVKMMNQLKVSLKCTQTPSYTIAELPFGNEAFSMTILLPHEHKTIEGCMSELTSDEWASWVAKTLKRPTNVWLPRFELNAELDLTEVMQAMGVEEAFIIESADFSKMSIGLLYCSLFKQNSFLKINEEGAEVTTVTTSQMGGYGSAGPLAFKVDRPFAFFISEKSTGIILFMGKINKMHS